MLRSPQARTGPAGQVSKPVAEYTDDHGSSPEYCGRCIHFISPRRCTRVEGDVHSSGWCKWFSRIRTRKPP